MRRSGVPDRSKSVRRGLGYGATIVLSGRGGPKRRCQVVWETGGELGVEFERPKKNGAA
jgi:hypothetical protein